MLAYIRQFSVPLRLIVNIVRLIFVFMYLERESIHFKGAKI